VAAEITEDQAKLNTRINNLLDKIRESVLSLVEAERTTYNSSLIKHLESLKKSENKKILIEKIANGDLFLLKRHLKIENIQSNMFNTRVNKLLEEAKKIFTPEKIYKAQFPFHYAAKTGNIEKIQQIISAGVDLNIVDNEGKTLGDCLNKEAQSANLINAIEKKNLALVNEILLLIKSLGCDVAQFLNTLCYQYGETPLQVAARNKDVNDPTKPPETKSMDIIKSLVAYGAEIEPSEGSKCLETPLCIAVNGGNLDAVKYFVENGANINRYNFEGKMPLSIVNARLDRPIFTKMARYFQEKQTAGNEFSVHNPPSSNVHSFAGKNTASSPLFFTLQNSQPTVQSGDQPMPNPASASFAPGVNSATGQ
jgi:ankyrin repeat protein